MSASSVRWGHASAACAHVGSGGATSNGRRTGPHSPYFLGGFVIKSPQTARSRATARQRARWTKNTSTRAHLLDRQRHPRALPQHELDHVRRQAPASRRGRHERSGRLVVQLPHVQPPHVGVRRQPAAPRLLLLHVHVLRRTPHSHEQARAAARAHSEGGAGGASSAAPWSAPPAR